MRNKWEDRDAIKYIKNYKKININKDLALRIYSTHLLGKKKILIELE